MVSTKEDLCGKYYIAALKDHVNLGFSLKGLSKKEQEFSKVLEKQ